MAEADPPGEEFSLARYRDYLRSLARARLGTHSRAGLEASDIVHDALLKAEANRDQFRGTTEQELAGWLRAILNNTLANALRTCSRADARVTPGLSGAADSSAAQPVEPAVDPGLPPEAVASRNEDLLRLAGALHRLPEDQRAVVELKHLHGLSLAEIGELTNRSRPSVVGLLFRGMKTLRVLLGESSDVVPSEHK